MTTATVLPFVLSNHDDQPIAINCRTVEDFDERDNCVRGEAEGEIEWPELQWI